MKQLILTILAIEFYANLNKYVCTLSGSRKTTDANGNEVSAKLFLTDKQFRTVANKAGILSRNPELILAKLKGAKIKVTWHEAGEEYITETGDTGIYEKSGYKLPDLSDLTVERSEGATLMAMAAMEYAETLTTTSPVTVAVDLEEDKEDEKIEKIEEIEEEVEVQPKQ